MANWWRLKTVSGPDAGKEYNLRKDRTVIGRVKGDVTFNGDSELSSVHAELTYDEEKGLMILRDLKSRNGCKVNGEKVDRRYLLAGDRIKVGVTEFVLEPPASEETVVSAGSGGNPPAPPKDEAAKSPEAAKPSAASASPDAPASAAAKSASDGEPAKPSKKGPSGRIVRSGYEAPTEKDFTGFFGRLFGVLFHPAQFMDFLVSEHSLILKGDPVTNAYIFAAIVLVFGGLINAGLGYCAINFWHSLPEGVDWGMSPLAVAFQTIIGFVLVPISALIFHGFCIVCGGKAPLKVAMRVACYMTAVYFLANASTLIPKAGPFVHMALVAYSFYVFSVAAIRIYYVGAGAAIGACAVSVALAVAFTVSSQRSALKFGELVKINSAQAPTPPVAVIPAGNAAPVAEPPKERDPAQAPPADPQPADPQPPVASDAPPAPPSADPAPPAMPSSDPEPPAMPSN